MKRARYATRVLLLEESSQVVEPDLIDSTRVAEEWFEDHIQLDS